MNERERLIEILKSKPYGYSSYEDFADYLLANGVIVTPCVAYNKKHERYQVIHRGKQGHIFASKLYRCRREAENALAERENRHD